jgi:flagellar hook protein FlgE
MWAQSSETGEPVIGGPGPSSLGDITAGALEESNVDLSEQLVNLIIAQRNFQASSKTIETANQITQTIINLR